MDSQSPEKILSVIVQEKQQACSAEEGSKDHVT